MSGGEGTTSQRRGEAGGRLTDHGRETETEAETDTENETHSPPSKPRDSSTTSDAGKTVSGARKTKNRILGDLKTGVMMQMPLPLRKRNPTLNCRGH